MLDLTNVDANQLKSAAKEMNSFLELSKEEAIKVTGKINTTVIGTKLEEAHSLLEDGEFEELSEETQETLTSLLGLDDDVEDVEDDEEEEVVETPKKKGGKKAPVVEEDDDEEDEDEEDEDEEDEDEESLVDLVTACTKMAQLKELVASEDEFKSLRKKLTKYPNVKALKGAMLKLADVEEEEVVETPKKNKTKDGTKKFNQTDYIRTALRKKTKRATITATLAKETGNTEKWGENRMKLYEKAYGDMGINDPKLKA